MGPGAHQGTSPWAEGPRTAMGELRGGRKVAQTRPSTRSRVLIALSLSGCAAACPARLVVEIMGCRRSLQADSDLFSWRCRVARRPIRENAIRMQTGGTRCSPRDFSSGLVSASPKWGIWVHSTATPVAGFSALCRLRDRSYVVGSTQHAPGHSVDAAGSRGRRGGVVSRTTAGKYRKARPSLMLER
jgi:hypothetical protein